VARAGDHPQIAAAFGAGFDVDLEHSFQALCPSHRSQGLVGEIDSSRQLANSATIRCKPRYMLMEKCVPIHSGFWQYGFNATYTQRVALRFCWGVCTIPGCFGSLLSAVNTELCRRVYRQPARVNTFTAFRALSKIIVIHSREGQIDVSQSLLVATQSFQGHLLALHGIHSAEPSDTGLVQFNGFARFTGCGMRLDQGRALIDQFLAKVLQLPFFHVRTRTWNLQGEQALQ
jgi:hypothetical protein